MDYVTRMYVNDYLTIANQNLNFEKCGLRHLTFHRRINIILVFLTFFQSDGLLLFNIEYRVMGNASETDLIIAPKIEVITWVIL